MGIVSLNSKMNFTKVEPFETQENNTDPQTGVVIVPALDCERTYFIFRKSGVEVKVVLSLETSMILIQSHQLYVEERSALSRLSFYRSRKQIL